MTYITVASHFNWAYDYRAAMTGKIKTLPDLCIRIYLEAVFKTISS